MRPLPLLRVALAAVALAGCSASTPRNGNGPGPGGDNGDNGNGDDGGGPVDMSVPVTPPGDDASIDPGGGDPNMPCSTQTFTPTKVGDPDILIILDRSGSMADGTPSKWESVTAALNDVITTLQNNNSPIEWGLIMFPTDGNCGVDPTPPVAIGMNKGTDIINAIMAVSPDGNTPLQAAVQNAETYYKGLNDGRAHYLLVATDGEPNCDGAALPQFCSQNMPCPAGQQCLFAICIDPNATSPAVMEIGKAAAMGIRTFVIGIDLGGDSMTLDQMATAGGTARAGTPKYYPAADQMSLESSLGNITQQVISCSFALQSLPMAQQMIEVSVGGKMIAQDGTHMNGWDVDTKTKTLTFYGAACTALQANPGVVSVGYTCPPPS